MDQSANAQERREPIAVIGIGCRFPGGADLDSLWRILRGGIETVGEYPGGRFKALDHFFATRTGKPNGAVTRRGGFLSHLDLFDADFFGISPREAVLLDPQHRLLLELGWEALEDAGLPLADVTGSRAGVFVGQWTSDFEECIHELKGDPQLYSTTGSGRYAAAARLAYHFDLRGPNLTLDTACSSSLVAVHLACQSLRCSESELALAGAVNLILRPEITQAYGAAGMLSPDGRCKFGSALANGYVRSEAGAVVVLKLLRYALADRDPIHAIIRGSAVNNDGSSSGLLVAPGRETQTAMIRTALRDAGVAPAEIDYIEAHGTGTAAGDPAELEAIGAVLAEAPRSRLCLVGSVKTNLGHAEAAAGLIGLCKVIVSLQHATIPATLHFNEPNANIPWERLPLRISSESEPWPDAAGPRIAAVNSFGITGTNAHAILESAPVQEPGPDVGERARLFVLSARTSGALIQAAESWRSRMQNDAGWPSSMADLAYTAFHRRTHHSCRLTVVAKHRTELHAELGGWLRHELSERVHSGRTPAAPSRVAFVFPGQGGQWPGMGRELFEQEAVFRETILRCERALLPHTGWLVSEEILSPLDSKNGEIDRVQPTLFALMIAFTELWRSWGVEPEAVVGHSMGEAAAAVVCGALSLEDGAAVIAHRSKLMKTVSGRGLMAMAALTLSEATEFLRSWNGRISIAANNSPASTVLSGDSDAVEEAIAVLESGEIFCRRIHVDVASHCSHMDSLAPELEQRLASVTGRTARLPLYSTSTGQTEDGTGLGAPYWIRNLRVPVLFADAVQRLLADGFRTFIEINAHPVLLQAIEESAKHTGHEVLALASQRRDKEQLAEMLASAGRLHVAGHSLTKLYPVGACLRLPAYPWQRERYWPEEASERRFRAEGAHPSLGALLESSVDRGTWLGEVDFRPPVDPVAAATWVLEITAAAAAVILATETLVLEDVVFQPTTASSEIGQLVVFSPSEGKRRFRLSAKTDDGWKSCCEGKLRPLETAAASAMNPSFPEHRIASRHPLTACLQSAAAMLSHAEGTVRVASIGRVERCAANPVGKIELRATAMLSKNDAVNIELRDESNALMARMLDLQFGISADAGRTLYQWRWTPIELPHADRETGGSFVVAGDIRLTERVATYLREQSIACVVATDASSVAASLDSQCRGVLWVVAERNSEPQLAVEAVSALATLVQSIETGQRSTAIDLWLVTTGAQAVGNAFSGSKTERPSVTQAALRGLTRVIRRERPELRCVSVDLSAAPSAKEIALLGKLLRSGVREDQMTVRDAVLYGLRLERMLESSAPSVALRRGAACLITGGFGDLGLSLAAFLAEKGAGHIVLAGRRGPNAAAQQRIARIEAAGTKVHCLRADVAESTKVADLLEEIGRIAPLQGIFHLAGITEDALLSDFSRASLEQVMGPKAFGAWNLHRQSSNLDYFVLYSSVAGVCSQPGQASYAAANAYLDGLAELRRTSGLPAVSIQWGPWKDAGMIRQGGAQQSQTAWAEQGIHAYPVETAIDAVRCLLAAAPPVALAAMIDWQRFSSASPEKDTPAFSLLVQPDAKSVVQPDMRQQLAALPAAGRIAAIELHLKTIVAAVLKSKVARIDAGARFGAMGVDSLMAVEIARRVTETAGLRLPVTTLFNFPTVELLANEMARRMDGAAPAAQARQERPEPAVCGLPSIEEMSEDEALQSLVKATGAL